MPLTKRQSEILVFLQNHILEQGYAPSFEEIAERFGFQSLATVHEHLTNLERKGYIRRSYNESRSIEVLPPRGTSAARSRSRKVGPHPIESLSIRASRADRCCRSAANTRSGCRALDDRRAHHGRDVVVVTASRPRRRRAGHALSRARPPSEFYEAGWIAPSATPRAAHSLSGAGLRFRSSGRGDPEYSPLRDDTVADGAAMPGGTPDLRPRRRAPQLATRAPPPFSRPAPAPLLRLVPPRPLGSRRARPPHSQHGAALAIVPLPASSRSTRRVPAVLTPAFLEMSHARPARRVIRSRYRPGPPAPPTSRSPDGLTRPCRPPRAHERVRRAQSRQRPATSARGPRARPRPCWTPAGLARA